MIRKVLAGAALAAAATTVTFGTAGAAVAHTDSGPQAGTMTNAQDATQAGRTSAGETTHGTGAASDFATDNGDVTIADDPGGILDTYGAPLVNVDLRCAVPATQGVGGNVLGGPNSACNVAPVDQFDSPDRLF